MDFESKIEDIIGAALGDAGYDIVRIQFAGGEHKTLQIMIERQDGEAISVDDCALASRSISVLLDVEDLITDHYTLEVSSPGSDRPLVKPKDFVRFQGETIKFELKVPVEGRKRFKGVLKNADEDKMTLVQADENEVEFAYNDIHKAKIVPQI